MARKRSPAALQLDASSAAELERRAADLGVVPSVYLRLLLQDPEGPSLQAVRRALTKPAERSAAAAAVPAASSSPAAGRESAPPARPRAAATAAGSG